MLNGEIFLISLFTLVLILLLSTTWYLDSMSSTIPPKFVRIGTESVSSSEEIPIAIKKATLTGIQATLAPIPPIQSTSVQKNPKSKEIVPLALLAHGEKHYILGLSDEDFRTTPLNIMMEKYRFVSEEEGNCNEDFGNKLIARWRAQRKVVCSSSQQPQQQSSIATYLMHQAGHAGGGDNLIHMRNVRVSLSVLADPTLTTPVIEKYVSTRHNEQPYIPFSTGFIQADCTPSPEDWRPESMPGWNLDWTVRAVQSVPQLKCDRWIEHNILIVQRDTFANFYHDSEDFLNVFLAMSILQWSLDNTQIYLTDLYPEGPFWEMWSRVFSGRYPARTAWHLQQEHRAGTRTCFKSLAVGIYGPAAPICLIATNSPCQGTALLKAYSDFVLRGMQLQDHTHYALPMPSSTLTITYMSRKPTPVWPERKYCNDALSYFTCKYWDGFGERRLGRMIQNEEALLEALRELTREKFSDDRKLVLNVVNFNDLSLPEQLRVDAETDIMVGPHGAGLTHSAFMRDRARLVELFVDGSGNNRHFHNMAAWYGRGYHELSCANPVEIALVVQTVREAVKAIEIHSY